MNAISFKSVRYRIIAVSMLAMAGMVIFSGYLVFEKRRGAAETAHLAHLVGLAPEISNLIHELQKERGLSAGFVGSEGRTFAEKLPEQRLATDGRQAALDGALRDFDTASYGDAFVRQVDAARRNLGQLAAKRRAVSAMNETVAGLAAYYTGTIASLFAVVEDMALLSTDSEITKAITAYISFVEGKEHAGIERAMGATGFGAGAFTPEVYRRFVQQIAAQDTLFTIFESYAAEEQTEFYRRTVAGDAVAAVDRMRKLAADTIETGDTGGVEGPYWFEQITKKINLLKQVEDRLSADLTVLTGERLAVAEKTFWTVAGFTLALLAATIGLSLYVAHGIGRSVTGLASDMTRLADGDRTVEIRTGGADEIGQMADAVRYFKDKLIEGEELAAEQEKERVAKEERARRQAQVTDAFNGSVVDVLKTLNASATELDATAQSMSATAEESSRQATAVSSASEEASSNVQTVASAAEELTSSIAEISRQVADSAKIAGAASAEAERTNASVESLNEAAQKIGDVVELINDIASQTNLLALNATIEAARAGEAGKGFTVVASEVKNLATQTAKATEEIAAQVSSMQEETVQAVDAIKGITETIGKVNEIATSISSAVEQQGAATGEISRNVQEAARGTHEVSSNITGVTHAAQETGSAASQVLSAAGDLHKQSDTLRQYVDRFIEQIKAA